MRKYLALAAVIYGLTGVGMGQVHLTGYISGILSDTVYYADSALVVAETDSLVIEPGAEFYFNGDYALKVYGYLQAEGTVDDSILFTQGDTSGGFWDGVNFYSEASDESVMRYCRVTGSNSTGIDINGCGPLIANCSVYDNEASNFGGGIYCNSTSSAYIENCDIYGNWAIHGGGITVNGEDVTVDNCRIFGNFAMGYGGGILLNNTAFSIENTAVAYNSGVGGIFSMMAAPNEIEYCGFYENEGGDFLGEALTGAGIVIGTNANGDSCDIYENLFLEPLFADVSMGDYQLTAMSPYVDAGNPMSPFDPDSTVTDIGFFSYFQNSGIGDSFREAEVTDFYLSQAYPNPFNQRVTLDFNLPETGEISLKVFDNGGREVQSLATGHSSLGKHSVVWEAEGVGSGVYFVRLTVEGGLRSEVEKVVLVK